LAYIGQVLLYILMLLVPVCGVLLVQGHGYPLMLWGIIKLPTIILPQTPSISHLIVQWHLWLANTIIILAVGHALIALMHHFILKDRLLLRMLPFSKKARL
ncbi:MAG: cytochrome b/b6 domain-containing protein, partial [Burkholderiales bacterium]|nr:cytochrome b/b6 domain-containing protein [Burkholderiales bacterium]